MALLSEDIRTWLEDFDNDIPPDAQDYLPFLAGAVLRQQRISLGHGVP
jgi:hypothetical protein